MQNRTELALQDLKKYHRVIKDQLNMIERDHLHTYLPWKIKEPILEAYIALNDTLENEIQELEEAVQSMKINQGLGLRK